jgi:hypothetical protein
VEDTLALNPMWVEEEEEEECDYCDKKDELISELKGKLAKAEKEIAQLKAAAKDPRDQVEVIKVAYKCNKCQKNFTTKASLIAHTVLFHPKYTFPCQVCKKVFCKKDSLEKHRQVKCKSPAAPEIVLDEAAWCTKCDKSFGNKADMRKHQILTHMARKPKQIECVMCPFKGDSVEVTTRHIDTAHLHGGPARRPGPIEQEWRRVGASDKPRPAAWGKNECRNGAGCKFLAMNRCRFDHQGAGPSRPLPTQSGGEEWQEVTHKKQQKVNKHHTTVQWCKFGLNCNKGRHCRFRHFETIRSSFPLLPMRPTK